MASWDWFHKAPHRHPVNSDRRIEPYTTLNKQVIDYSNLNNNFLLYNQSDSRINDMIKFRSQTPMTKPIAIQTEPNDVAKFDYSDDLNRRTGQPNGHSAPNGKSSSNYFSDDEVITQRPQSRRRVSFEIDEETKVKSYEVKDPFYDFGQTNSHSNHGKDYDERPRSAIESRSRNQDNYWAEKEPDNEPAKWNSFKNSCQDYPYSDDELIYFRPQSTNGRRMVYEVDRSSTPMPYQKRPNNGASDHYSNSFYSDDDYVEFRPQKMGQKTVYEADRSSTPRPSHGHQSVNHRVNLPFARSSLNPFAQPFQNVPEIRVTEYNDDEGQEYNATIQHLACE